MSTVVQELYSLLRLVPDAGSFKAGDRLLENAKKTVVELGAALFGLQRQLDVIRAPSLKGVAGLIEGTFDVRKIYDFVRTTLSTVPEIGDLADQTGVAAEVLQRLGFAATQSGSDTETLNGGVRKLIRNLGEAKSGSQGAIDAFAEVGIVASQVSKESIESGRFIEQLADGIAKIEDPARRAAAAQTLLGLSGGKLAPFFAQGSQAIAELGRTVEVLTRDEIDAIGKVDDKINEIGARVSIAGKQLVSVMLPAIEAVVDGLTKFAKLIQRIPVLLKKVQTAFVFLAKVIGVVAVGAGLKWLATLAAFIAGNALVIANNGLLAGSFGGLITVIDFAARSVLAFIARLALLAAPMIAVGIIGAIVVFTIDEIVTAMQGGRTVFDDVIGKFHDVSESLWNVAMGGTDAGIVMRIVAGVGAVLAAAFGFVDDTIRGFFNTLITLGEFWDDFMLNPIEAVMSAIRALVATIRSEVAGVLSLASRAVDALPSSVQGFIGASGLTAESLSSAAAFVAPSAPTIGSTVSGVGAGNVSVGAPSIQQTFNIAGNADARVVTDIGRATGTAVDAAISSAAVDLLPGRG